MRGRYGPRSRHHHGGRWRVFARVERFTEPALLLLLRERPRTATTCSSACPS